VQRLKDQDWAFKNLSRSYASQNPASAFSFLESLLYSANDNLAQGWCYDLHPAIAQIAAKFGIGKCFAINSAGLTIAWLEVVMDVRLGYKVGSVGGPEGVIHQA
jgi:hypothetical protein